LSVTSLLTGLLRGTAAGAAGTTALDVATFTDMAVRARPASDSPAATVSTLADRLDVSVPGRGGERDNRLQGLGGLSGAVTGIGVGALAGVLRAAGVRLPGVIGGPLLGAAAMAASDLPMARLGLSDPRRWGTADWVADALPHLVYGIAAHATLTATFRADERIALAVGTRRPATVGMVVRAAALGAATGGRSTAGLTALAWRARRDDSGLAGRLADPRARAVLSLATLGEGVADKSPAIPPRDSAQVLAPRVVLAGTGAQAVARRDGREGGPAVLAATAASVASALGGMRLRAKAQQRWGSDLPGALIEDAATALLAWFGAGRPRR
jgi:uncharacterized membrane protein